MKKEQLEGTLRRFKKAMQEPIPDSAPPSAVSLLRDLRAELRPVRSIIVPPTTYGSAQWELAKTISDWLDGWEREHGIKKEESK